MTQKLYPGVTCTHMYIHLYTHTHTCMYTTHMCTHTYLHLHTNMFKWSSIFGIKIPMIEFLETRNSK